MVHWTLVGCTLPLALSPTVNVAVEPGVVLPDVNDIETWPAAVPIPNTARLTQRANRAGPAFRV
jgi:hypothetical protein